MKLTNYFKKLRGITLVELMVTIVVVAILAAISFPSLEKSIRNRELKNATSNLYAILDGIRAWELQHPSELFVGQNWDNIYWISHWKENLSDKYLTKMKDESPNELNLLIVGAGARQVHYHLTTDNYLTLNADYFVNGEFKGRVALTYDGDLNTATPGSTCASVPGAQCGDPSLPGCSANYTCQGCFCIPNLNQCGDGIQQSGEECGEPGLACAPDEVCRNCICEPSLCGNGIVEGLEECESSSQCTVSAGSPAGTTVICASCQCQEIPPGGQFCGDGAITGTEICDPGNPPLIPQIGCDAAAGFECNSTCNECVCPAGQEESNGHCCPIGTAWDDNSSTCAPDLCGNGEWDDGESCDSSASPSGCPVNQVCNSACTACECPPGYHWSRNNCCPIGEIWTGSKCSLCGNGELNPPEACDPTAPPPDDMCPEPVFGLVSSNSKSGGFMAPVEPGPAPDPDGSGSGGGSGGSGPGQVCGNGIVEGTEECDDGNLISGDGCSSTCQIEPGICRECQCTFGEPVCGNGLLETGEQCDDGNNEDGDGCSSTCQWEEYCGDGIIQPGLGEVCDSGVGCGGLPGPRVCADDCTECLCAPFLCVPGTIPDMATCTCVPAPCTQDSDCGDPDQCSQCNLASGVCEPKPDGALCEDGDLCTMDTCSAGFCLPDTAVTCDDGNPCTSDSCDPDVGCVHEPLTGTPCNDGNACTQTDICQAGVCTGTDPVVCTALDQCHDAGVCDPGTGVCSNPVKPLGTPCDIDGQPDTCCEWEICLNGNCIADGVVCSGFQTCDETPGPTCGQCI